MHPVVFEALILAALVIFAVTQIVLPLLTGAPLFPSLRFRRRLRQLDDAQTEKVDVALAKEAYAVQAETIGHNILDVGNPHGLDQAGFIEFGALLVLVLLLAGLPKLASIRVVSEVVANHKFVIELVKHEAEMDVLERHDWGRLRSENNLTVNLEPLHSGLKPSEFGLSERAVALDIEEGLAVRSQRDSGRVNRFVRGISKQREVANLNAMSSHDIYGWSAPAIPYGHATSWHLANNKLIEISPHDFDVGSGLQRRLFSQMLQRRFGVARFVSASRFPFMSVGQYLDERCDDEHNQRCGQPIRGSYPFLFSQIVNAQTDSKREAPAQDPNVQHGAHYLPLSVALTLVAFAFVAGILAAMLLMIRFRHRLLGDSRYHER